jgi:hypothetical protein
MRAGHHDLAAILRLDQRHRIDHPHRAMTGVRDARARLADLGNRAFFVLGILREARGRLLARVSRQAAVLRGRRVDRRDDSRGHRVRAVSDARAAVVDGARGYAEAPEPRNAGNTRRVLADAGVIEDHRAHAGLGREPRRVETAMRPAHHDLPARRAVQVRRRIEYADVLHGAILGAGLTRAVACIKVISLQ